MEGWQSKAAFVIQFRESTDIQAGRVEGKIEHIASYQGDRGFSPSTSCWRSSRRVLAEIKRDPQ